MLTLAFVLTFDTAVDVCVGSSIFVIYDFISDLINGQSELRLWCCNGGVWACGGVLSEFSFVAGGWTP